MDPDRATRTQRTNTYTTQVWYFLACFIFLVAALRLASVLHSKYSRGRRSSRADPETISSTPSSALQLRRFPLAVINTYRILALRCTVRVNIGTFYTLNIAEVCLTLAYIVALFTWTFINTTNLEGVKLDPIYWSNRASPMAASQFPLITALGSKNNIISLLTGVSYEKLNFFHRMASRVVFVLLWTHASEKLALNGIGPGVWYTTWLHMGLLAIIAFSLVILVPLRPVREKSYQLFFWTHFVSVFIFLLGAYYHTRLFNFQKYIWPCFVIWGFDRSIRLLRLLVFNFSSPAQGPTPESSHTGSQPSTSELELVSSDIMRLTIPRPRHFHWSPGQNVYLIIPEVMKFLPDAHPFTVATVDHEASNLESASTRNEKGEKSSANGVSNSDLVFFIDVRSGFTKRLAGCVSSSDVTMMKLNVLVDGPYGSPPDLRVFDTCVLLAGGTGASYTLPLFLDIIEKVRQGESNCRRLVFIWSIRDIRHTTLISPAVTKAIRTAPPTLRIDIHIHVTRHSSNSTPNPVSEFTRSSEECMNSSSSQAHDPGKMFVAGSPEKQTSDVKSMLDMSVVKLHSGRPNISSILEEESGVARGERMGVSVCGSDSMVHSTRSALGMGVSGPAAVMKGGASVSLFVEAFGYV